MSENSLFRPESVNHQRVRLFGEIIVVQPKSFTWIIAMLLIVFIVVVLFATQQTYKRKETVVGFLKPQQGVVKVYSSRGGLIDKVLVKHDEFVIKGDPLIELRIEQQTAGGTNNAIAIKESLLRDLRLLQQHLHQLPQRLKNDLSQTERQLKGKNNELSTLVSELDVLSERLELNVGQYEDLQQLADREYVSMAMVDRQRESVLELEQQLMRLERARDTAMTQIEILVAERDTQLPTQYDKERNDLSVRIEAIKRNVANFDLASAHIVTAPSDGYVDNLVAYIGSTALANRNLLSLRPKDSHLTARLLVPSRAAGLIEEGQVVKLQYDAFPYQRFGVFSGSVSEVATTILIPGEISLPTTIAEPFYIVDVKVDQQWVMASGKKVSLKPGMLLRADVVLEERTILQWLFDPIYAITGRL